MISQDWGPFFWFTLHTVTFSLLMHKKHGFYNEERKDSFIKFVYAFAENIPCSECSLHFLVYLKMNPIQKYMDDPMNVVGYFFDLHNDVNKRLNKKPMKFDDFLDAYISEKWKGIGNYPVYLKSVEERTENSSIVVEINKSLSDKIKPKFDAI